MISKIDFCLTILLLNASLARNLDRLVKQKLWAPKEVEDEGYQDFPGVYDLKNPQLCVVRRAAELFILFLPLHLFIVMLSARERGR